MTGKGNISMNYLRREFDENGLLLAGYQAELFEKSVEHCDCSSLIFLRRFLKSEHLKKLDKNESFLLSLNVWEGLEEIEAQFGKSEYGSEKYSPDVMFWMGYIFRYISYTRRINTNIIFAAFTPQELNKKYYVYHTQDPEWVIERLLEGAGLDESFFDSNERLKKLLREAYKKRKTA